MINPWIDDDDYDFTIMDAIFILRDFFCLHPKQYSLVDQTLSISKHLYDLDSLYATSKQEYVGFGYSGHSFINLAINNDSWPYSWDK